MAGDKVERLELFHVEVPLPTPLFPIWIPGHAAPRLVFTLLRVRTKDGLVGHATGPALGEERRGVGELVAPFLVGVDPFDVDAVRERLRQASYLGWRNNWMDVAFYDVAAQAAGLSVAALLAKRLGAEAERPAAVPAVAALSELRRAPARAEALERAVGYGFRSLRLGVHHDAEAEDLEHLTVARKAAGPGVELSAHAHQAWSVSFVRAVERWDFQRALRFAEAAAELDYRWVQEPLHEEDWDGLERLRAASPIPVAGGDLSVSALALRNLARVGCYDILTPSAGFAGLGRLEVAMREAKAHGFGFVPSTYGDGTELAANLHAAAAWAAMGGEARVSVPHEPPALGADQRDALLETCFELDGQGALPVPAGPGLGIQLRAAALARWGRRFYETTPVRLLVGQARRSGLRQTATMAAKGPRSPSRRPSTSGSRS